jgi:predicted ester cyclase
MPASPSEVAHAWFARVWNAGEEAAIDELFVPDTIAHGLGPEPLRGPDAFKPFFRAFKGALPDIHVTVTNTVTEGNLCVTHCDVEGTHTGDTLGFAPTNRRVKFSGFTLTRVEDGRIIEGWNTYDFLTMYQQLGVIPAALV